MASPHKAPGGIEAGEYQTSGVNDAVGDGESKPRGGYGSARDVRDHREKMAAEGRMRRDRATPHMFAHKMPLIDG